MQPSTSGPALQHYLRFTVIAIPAIALVGYFVMPGWFSAALVVLEFLCLGVLCLPALRPRLHAVAAVREVRWLLYALAAPMAAITIVETVHGEFSQRHFESPMRLFLAGTLLLAAAAMRIDFSRLAAFLFPAAVFVCAAWVFFPGASAYYWDGRAATIFMDPITLSQHTIISGFICALLIERGQPRWQQLLLAATVVAGFAVAVATHSRTGWLMVPVLALLLTLKNARLGKATLPVAVVVTAVLVGAVYYGSSVMQERFGEALHDIDQYLNGGNKDTSVGIRLSLFRTNLILFWQQPWTGWGYIVTPDLEKIPALQAFRTTQLAYYWKLAGGHNEYLQSMMRMGVLGLASRLLLMLVPLAVFARAARSGDPVRARNGYLGLAVTIGYATSGLTVEVFNLSYAASFYAALVALFGAAAVPSADTARVAVAA